MTDLCTITPDGELRLHFHAGQRRAWDSPKRFVPVVAGTQSGKTSFGPIWLYREIQRRGPGDYMVVTPTYPLLSKKALPEFLRLFKRQLRLGDYQGQQKLFTFSPDGCRQVFGNVPDVPTQVYFCHAQDPDSLESATAKGAWLDEAGQKKFRLGSWEAIQRRLSIHEGRVLITTTPYDLGWLKQQLHDPWQAAGRDHPLIDVVNFRSIDNPAFPRAEYERARASLPGWKFRMFYDGLFERPAGLIYDCFDERLHRCPRFAIPDDWQRYLGLDFGGVNTVGLFYAEEPRTGKLYCYREYRAGGRTAREHSAALLAGEPMVPVCVGGSKSEGQWRDEFRAAGLPVREPCVSEVEVGIDRVYGAFKRGELVVLDDLAGCLDQLASYSRVLDDAGEPTEAIEDKASYHYCFVAGTMIRTNDGDRPIETLRPGDMVLTRAGLRPVVANMERGPVPIRHVAFDNGRELVGTPDHPVWVNGNGWRPIDSLRYNDSVISLIPSARESLPWPRKKRSSAVRRSGCLASHGSATLTRRDGQTESISAMPACTFIVSPGNCITAKFRTASMSTTRTRTRETTPWKTFSFFPMATTYGTISSESVRQPGVPTWTEFAISLRPGMGAPKVVSGTGSTVSRLRKIFSRSSGGASGAAMNTRCGWPNRLTAFARRLAGLPHGETVGLMTLSAPVLVAGKNLRSTGTARRGIAPVCVRGVCAAGTGTVYNLTVAGRHEYFANGILVSNCDAKRYIVSWLKREGAGAWDPTPHEDAASDMSKAPENW